MNAQQKRAGFFFRLSLVFFVTYLLLIFFGSKPPSENPENTAFKVLDSNYAIGQLVEFEIKNNSAESQTFQLKIAERTEGNWENIFDIQEEVGANTTKKISFTEKNTELFEIGKFQAQLFQNENFIAETEFSVEEAGIFRSLFRALFFKPIENLLVFFLTLSGHYLWVAIILLTILIKTILIAPSKKGILAQQKMQALQPEIEEIKKKYGKNPQLQAQEMMGLWKKHKVNPAGVFVPMFIQFPVLIALFFVIKEGLAPHNAFLIYPISALQNFDFTAINFHFLWLDLSIRDPFFLLPIAVGLLQFWQMYSIQKKRTKIQNSEPSAQDSAMKMMTYILPVVVVLFSLTLPSAVVLYWGISTIFAIAQQYFLQKTEKNHPSKHIVDAVIVEKEPKKIPKKNRIRA